MRVLKVSGLMLLGVWLVGASCKPTPSPTPTPPPPPVTSCPCEVAPAGGGWSKINLDTPIYNAEEVKAACNAIGSCLDPAKLAAQLQTMNICAAVWGETSASVIVGRPDAAWEEFYAGSFVQAWVNGNSKSCGGKVRR